MYTIPIGKQAPTALKKSSTRKLPETTRTSRSQNTKTCKKQKNKKKDLERERNITYIRLLPAIRL
jgi:hypothetical protein